MKKIDFKNLSEKQKSMLLYIGIPSAIILFVGLAYVVTLFSNNEPSNGVGLINTDVGVDSSELLSLQKDSMYNVRIDDERRRRDYGDGSDGLNTNLSDIFATKDTAHPQSVQEVQEQQDDEAYRRLLEQQNRLLSSNPEAPAKSEDLASDERIIRQALKTRAPTKLPASVVNDYSEVSSVNAQPAVEKKKKGFQSLVINGAAVTNESGETQSSSKNSSLGIRALVMERVLAEEGSPVMIRTTEQGKIGQVVIPKNTMLTGAVNVSDNRIRIRIGGANISGKSIPLDLNVYDNDGIEGLLVAKSQVKQAANETYKDQIESVTQTAESVAGVFGKSLGIIRGMVGQRGAAKVFIPDGYRIIIK